MTPLSWAALALCLAVVAVNLTKPRIRLGCLLLALAAGCAIAAQLLNLIR